MYNSTLQLQNETKLSRIYWSDSLVLADVMENLEKQVHDETSCYKLVEILPGHELLKLGTGQVETGPVSVSHRLVFRRSQVGQQGRHLVKRSPAYSLVVPGNKIIMNHFTKMMSVEELDQC